MGGKEPRERGLRVVEVKRKRAKGRGQRIEGKRLRAADRQRAEGNIGCKGKRSGQRAV
jgi:hypothetical protein